MAEHVVVPDRPVGELGKMQGGDLVGTGGPEPRDHGRVVFGGLVGADVGAPAGGLAGPVEHVLVRERHAEQRPCCEAFLDGFVGGSRRLQRLVVLEGDDGVRALMDGLETHEQRLGRLDAGDFAGLDLPGEVDGGELVDVHYWSPGCSSSAFASRTAMMS
jgi:hypothetical protein